MSETLQQGWFRRLNHTPWRDLIRGELTGRLDWKGRINASSLPASIQSLLLRVTKQTRLWSIEKADVASELIAHFHDGIDAGTSPDELIKSFGEACSIAKLIRRAKVRNRPIAWHIWRACRFAFVIVVVIYFGLMVRLLIGSPNPKVDYIATINSRLDAVPIDQRAWPIYRQASIDFRKTEPPDSDNAAKVEWSKMLNARPGMKRWPSMMNWLEQHQDVIRFARAASEKPSLGFVLGKKGADNDPTFTLIKTATNGAAEPEEWLVNVRRPDLNELRALSNLMSADASLAIERHDRERLMSDLSTILRMSDQILKSNNFLMTSLVGIGIRKSALDRVERTLVQSPELFSDADLQALAHLLAGPKVAADMIDLRGEEDLFKDAIQRMYTDDGHGDGRMTRRGLETLGWIYSSPNQLNLAYGVAPFMASRKQLTDKYDQIIRVAEQNFNRPLWEANLEVYDQEVMRIHDDRVARYQYALIAVFSPSLSRAQLTVERFIGWRDGIVCGLALEMYHRKQGKYPATLAELSPSLLPTVPLDRLTGEPVKYRIVDGHPLIYSVGSDLDDDGGRPPVGKNGKVDLYPAAEPKSMYPQSADGDWILFPQPVIPIEEPDDDASN